MLTKTCLPLRFFVLSLLLLPAWLCSQSPVLAPPDARSRALGGAGVTATTTRAVWQNPAGLAGVRGLRAGLHYQQRYGLDELGVAAAHLSLRRFGVQVVSLGFAGYAEQRVGVAYGRPLSERLRVGLQLGLLARRLHGTAARQDVLAGVGAQYVLTDALHLGATYTFSGDFDRYPHRWRAGVGYALSPRVTLLGEVEVRAPELAGTRFGAVYRPDERVHILLGAAPLARQVTFGLTFRPTARVALTATSAAHAALGLSPAIGAEFDEGEALPRKQTE